jgi:hypothetical protein
MDGQYHNEELKRQQIEEALERIIEGKAENSDIALIYFECGLPAPVKTGIKKEKENGFYSG